MNESVLKPRFLTVVNTQHGGKGNESTKIATWDLPSLWFLIDSFFAHISQSAVNCCQIYENEKDAFKFWWRFCIVFGYCFCIAFDASVNFWLMIEWNFHHIL